MKEREKRKNKKNRKRKREANRGEISKPEMEEEGKQAILYFFHVRKILLINVVFFGLFILSFCLCC